MDGILVNCWLGGQSGGGGGGWAVSVVGRLWNTPTRKEPGCAPAAPTLDALGHVTQLEDEANLMPARWKNI